MLTNNLIVKKLQRINNNKEINNNKQPTNKETISKTTHQIDNYK